MKSKNEFTYNEIEDDQRNQNDHSAKVHEKEMNAVQSRHKFVSHCCCLNLVSALKSFIVGFHGLKIFE